jgi:hypothetical protein
MLILNPLIAALDKVLDFVVWLSDNPVTKPFMTLFVWIGFAVSAFQGITTALTFFGGGTLPAFASVLGMVSTGLGALFSEVIVPVLLIGAAIAGIVALLYHFSPAFKGFADGLMGGAKHFMHDPMGSLLKIGPVMDMFFDRLWGFLGKVVSGITDAIKGFFDGGAGKAVSDIKHAALGAATTVLKSLGGAIGAITKGQPAEAATLFSPALLAASATTSGITGQSSDHPFGWLSGKYESGKAGTIGDHGHAFGAWQFDARYHTPQNFVDSLKTSNPAIYNRLHPVQGSIFQGKAGAFGQEWQHVGADSPDLFKHLQREFAKQQYLAPLIHKFGSALADPVLQEVAFSTSIHHGVGGASSILQHAGINDHHMKADDLITNIYKGRNSVTDGRFSGRFVNESGDAHLALAQENNELLRTIASNQDKHMAKNDAHQKTAQRIAQVNSPSLVAAARTSQLGGNNII